MAYDMLWAVSDRKRRNMRKILILSCNTGEGHNSAAKAISGYLSSIGTESEVLDTLSLVGKGLSQSVSDMYLHSTRTNLFKYLYKIGGAVSESIKMKSIIYTWNKMYSRRLLEYIENGGYDAVICVHLFPAEAMTALKTSGKTGIPAIFVMTDYTCIPFLDETSLDSYVIPHEHLTEEFAGCGIPREKLRPLGIPVDSRFLARSSRHEARKAISGNLIQGISPDHDWFLVMTGSMGFGNTHGLISEIMAQAGTGTEIIVICGRNEEMLRQIRDDFSGTSSVHPVGFTDKIPLLMDACDVLFTKPGGISSTEAMQKRIPLIHTAPIPGCETRNAEFFHYHGMSYSSTDTSQQVSVAIRLCKDKAFRAKMKCAQAANANPDTCRDIITLLEGISSAAWAGYEKRTAKIQPSFTSFLRRITFLSA